MILKYKTTFSKTERKQTSRRKKGTWNRLEYVKRNGWCKRQISIPVHWNTKKNFDFPSLHLFGLSHLLTVSILFLFFYVFLIDFPCPIFLYIILYSSTLSASSNITRISFYFWSWILMMIMSIIFKRELQGCSLSKFYAKFVQERNKNLILLEISRKLFSMSLMGEFFVWCSQAERHSGSLVDLILCLLPALKDQAVCVNVRLS